MDSAYFDFLLKRGSAIILVRYRDAASNMKKRELRSIKERAPTIGIYDRGG